MTGRIVWAVAAVLLAWGVLAVTVYALVVLVTTVVDWLALIAGIWAGAAQIGGA